MEQPHQAAVRRLSGGHALAEMLRGCGAGPMFGMGGFQLLPFYEAVRTLGLAHHLVNDERSGAFAADAYARVTQRPGVCDATLGPGATNLVSALVESLNAGIAQVVLVGDAHRAHASKNMTQEAKQVELLRPAAKELIRIERIERIPEAVRRAFAVATSGRPGPVVIDVPEDVCHGDAKFDDASLRCAADTQAVPALRIRPAKDAVERAARLLRSSRRPLLLAGGGVHLSGAYAALQSFAESQAIPVAHTMSGKGALACAHPLSGGIFGRYSRIANDLIAGADLLVVAGCKLGEIATKRYQLIPPETPIVQLEIVAEEIGRTSRIDVALWGDVRAGLEDLGDALRDAATDARAERRDYVGEIAVRMARWRDEAADRLHSDDVPIDIGRVMNELNALMPRDAVLVADGGFAAHWAALFFDTKQAGRGFVANRGFASIGYGLPGGIGAQLGVGVSRRVVALTGDGGFNMAMGELETARRIGANLVICVFNNAASGYVKALQHALYGPARHQSADLLEMDYAAIARAMGCAGVRVTDPAKLRDALRLGLENIDAPTLIDIAVTRDPARMLPGADSRTHAVPPGDRTVEGNA